MLGKGVDAGPLYRWVNGLYNRASVFSNLDDGPADLEKILRTHFPRWSLEVVGSVAFFTGRA